MLSGLIGQYKGDVHKALAAYNSGDPNGRGTATTWPDGRQLGYADSVMRHYGALGHPTPPPSPSNEETSKPMSSFLSHIAHGVETGLSAFAATGNPAIAAGAGVLGAVSDPGNGTQTPGQSASSLAFPQMPMLDAPLLPQMQAENRTEQQSVNQLSAYADLISSSD